MIREQRKSDFTLSKDYKVAIVVAKWNYDITGSLENGAISALKQYELNTNDVFYVPGAVELPLFAKLLAQKEQYDAIVCLGCVIRGDTTHYDYVCNISADGIAKVSYDFNIPVMFGVVTTENLQQALDRSRGDESNKGFEVTVGALEMLSEIEKLNK